MARGEIPGRTQVDGFVPGVVAQERSEGWGNLRNVAKILNELKVGEPISALPRGGHPRVGRHEVLNATEVGAESASLFHQPQLIFFGVVLVSFDPSLRPVIDAYGQWCQDTLDLGPGKKWQNHIQPEYE